MDASQGKALIKGKYIAVTGILACNVSCINYANKGTCKKWEIVFYTPFLRLKIITPFAAALAAALSTIRGQTARGILH